MVADFQRFYGLRLASAVFGDDGYSPGELLELIGWLPDTSAFHASKHGGREFYGWGADRVTATVIANKIEVGNKERIAVAGAKPKKLNLLSTPWDKKPRSGGQRLLEQARQAVKK